MNLNILIDEFLIYCETVSRSANTLKAYRGDLKYFLIYANANGVEKAEQLNKNFLESVFEFFYSTEAKATAYRKGATVKSFLSWAKKKGYIAAGIYEKSDYILLRETKKDMNTISVKAVSDLLDKLRNEYKEAKTEYQKMVALRSIIIAELLCYSGLRISELCALKSSDISFFHDFYSVNIRGFRKRILYITNKEARDNLKQYFDLYSLEMEKAEHLLFNSSIGPLSDQVIRRMLKQKSNEIGLSYEITPKVLRYTLVENMVKSKVETSQLQNFLGDKEISTTKQYFKDRDLKSMNIINPEEVYRM